MAHPDPIPGSKKEIWVFLVEFPDRLVGDAAVTYVLDGDSDDVRVHLVQRLPFPAPPKALDLTLVD
jgi:hypothetical protein